MDVTKYLNLTAYKWFLENKPTYFVHVFGVKTLVPLFHGSFS